MVGTIVFVHAYNKRQLFLEKPSSTYKRKKAKRKQKGPIFLWLDDVGMSTSQMQSVKGCLWKWWEFIHHLLRLFGFCKVSGPVPWNMQSDCSDAVFLWTYLGSGY